jgi:multicomponent Na+:H+ antiporter subunit B
MRNSILENVVRLFLWVTILLSVYLLIRGHNSPGGGFIGGIIASTGFIFYSLVYGSAKIKTLLRFSPIKWMGFGLLLAFISAVVPLFFSKEVLTALWLHAELPLLGKVHLGTPLLFDAGIFLTVNGVILTIVISIMEELKWN